MTKRTAITWYSVVGIIGILFGVFYSLFGLERLPVYDAFVPESVYGAWSNGLYGSTFIGFSVLLFFAGRYAFERNDKRLMSILLYGVMSWITVEALFSAYYGIYINVLVDIALTAVLGLPLVIGIRSKRTTSTHTA